jgi:hypothetical protein
VFLSKLKNKFTKEEKDKEQNENENKDYDEAFADLVVKYIIENFDKFNECITYGLFRKRNRIRK